MSPGTRDVVLLLAAVATIGIGDAASAADERPPNILFILADDHATAAISAYGSAVNTTPHIDRLAAGGMTFLDCFVTNSICGPSRAVILTGKHSHVNGFHRNGVTFDGTQPTFPKLLRAAGYQTAVIGKWHLGSDPTGFDHWNILPGQGDYFNPDTIDDGERTSHEGYVTDIVTDLAIEWLDETRDPDRPFLLMVQHKAPHRSWQPAPRHFNLHDLVAIPEHPTLYEDLSTRGTAAREQDMTIAGTLTPYDLKTVEPKNLTEQQKELWHDAFDRRIHVLETLTGTNLVRFKYFCYMRDYLSTVAGLDENVGRLLAHLAEAGLEGDTIVVYSSDQGFFLGEHGWFDKRWMYEPSLRTPLIVRWPGVTAPAQATRAMVSNLDLAQTFLEAAGVPVPDDMQGASLVPLLRGETPADWRTSVYYHYYQFPGTHSVRRHYGVRGERYKLIHFYNLGEWELYDLVEDPHETRNLYDDPARAEVVATMKRELARLRELYAVPEDEEPVER